MRAGSVLNAAGAWTPRIVAMIGVTLPVRAAPLQMLVTEALPPAVAHLVAHCGHRLTVTQARNGNIIIGGGWRARLDAKSGRMLTPPSPVSAATWASPSPRYRCFATRGCYAPGRR